jgi:hypothetical protein
MADAFDFKAVHVDRVDYQEWYEVDRATFDSFTADLGLAREFADRAKRRELDNLLLFKPGRLRDEP